jgi:D-beta-D-heptose 7-phosphate kinase/D-beta-D-heptose 1-phosphate adenosyltransferase
MIDKQRKQELLGRFTDRTILVVGDLMLDEFTWGQVRRISPEAPVPVVEVDRETYRLGGCANVAANIRALGGNPKTIAVVGRDAPADRLRALMAELAVETSGLVEDRQRRTTLKTRIIAHGQQVVRADREDRSAIPDAVVDQLAGRFLDEMSSAEAVVVSDYDKGVVNAGLLGRILPEAGRVGLPVFLDPKVHHADYYKGATLITPNHREAELLSGMAIRSASDLEAAGRSLLERFSCPYLLITRGEDGMTLFGDGAPHHIPASAREVFDVTGAGDTVIATLALAYAGGGTIEESAWLANDAAGVVVGKVGTATLTREELTRAFDRRQ